ncbi:Cobyric acid synthase [Pseudonocardia dioxanivorans CB1190]|uniref:Cobyric acid synthase n=1 Tax=Pseudonocardia dioxanivorans (strain ATCC 55486 / DSM 44775 / JCM 13855 / CB1190) TaxID=675635 RepID=F4CJH1_PSEUX|nr:Cobyric acid synthase [Pseudonocardia dioxanivorans CB1190]
MSDHLTPAPSVPAPSEPGLRGALLVAGTSSDAGKSAVVAGLCRWLWRRGVSVAPFKAQNMSNNSVVTVDGGEIGRAQAMQAHACGLAPSVEFNPVLLKPGSDRSSQVVVRGRVAGQVSAVSYRARTAALGAVVAESLAGLRARFDVVVCEGAGSPAEINLRAGDITNMGLAQAAGLPVVVVGDIDRGGVLAHLFGTLAVLDRADQARVAGFVVNKFRGDPALLAPGLDRLRALTGRPTFGVLPWSERLWLDAEDSLSAVADAVVGRPGPPWGAEWLRVGVVRLPRMSNATDVEALACEPGVAVRYVSEPSRLVDVDVVVVPGSKATVADLGWLRRSGLAAAVVAHAGAGKPVLGICGGYQMLGRRIVDPGGVEVVGGADVAGLGLLDLEVRFEAGKHLGTPVGTAWGQRVRGYEIHHGRVVVSGDPVLVEEPGEGSDAGVVLGTHWHGLLENDGFRRVLLTRLAGLAGRDGFVVAPGTDFAAERAAQLDVLGDLVADHLDTAAIEHVINHGAPADLPTLTTGLAGSVP